MSSNPQPALAIRAVNLGKQYRIGQGAAYQTLRDSLANTVRHPFRLLRQSEPPNIWALQDVSFDIPAGQAVGLIGRNGAGKSTLLKVLSRITSPTCGSLDLYGRVGSLLEVGTGFHAELTGRENIYLNGAILGMRRREIDQKFDEIVDFAEIEKFIDTPVKFYSSGMYMRLAFSVAAHLEPEILLVDEVLAVGDAIFQKKALGKMGEVSHGGRTVVFVSHNLEAVISLTTRSLVLDSGRVVFDGPSESAVQFYRRLFAGEDFAGEYTNPDVKVGVRRARVIASEPVGVHRFGEPLAFEFELALDGKVQTTEMAFQVLNERMQPVINPRWADLERAYAHSDTLRLRCELPAPRLYQGRYSLRIFMGDRGSGIHIETVDGVCGFEVSMDHVPTYTAWIEGAAAYVEDTAWQVQPPAGA